MRYCHWLTRAARIPRGVRDVGAGDADSQSMLARCSLCVPAGRRPATVDRLCAQDLVVNHKRKGVRAANCTADFCPDRYYP